MSLKTSSIQQLAGYVDALRPIIYIQHFDFNVVDKLVSQVAGERKIYEYHDAGGYLDFKTKNPLGITEKYSLRTFLELLHADEFLQGIILLKDVHTYFDDPVVVAYLKAIATKTLYQEDYNVVIVLASKLLRIPSELENYVTVFEIPVPKENEIKKIIRQFAVDQSISIGNDLVDQFALSFKGLDDFEITQILNLAYQNGGCINEKDKDLILLEKEQIIKKSGIIEIVNFTETIEDIGGLENLKGWLSKKAKIFRQLDQAIKFGVDIPKGLMIIGMAGCGKSLTAKVTANLFEVPLLRLDVGKLLGKYVGESEANMRRALGVAEAVSPCVLWIDEIEKAFSGIGETSGGGQVTTRLVGSFLTWLQEKESTVFIVATANDISNLPTEFLRKGRFDELFFADLPNAEERRKIFEIHLKKRKKWNREIDTIRLIHASEGFSGADIESVIQEVVETAFIEQREMISTKDLLTVLEETKPISKTLKEKVDKNRKSLENYDIKPASKDLKEQKEDAKRYSKDSEEVKDAREAEDSSLEDPSLSLSKDAFETTEEFAERIKKTRQLYSERINSLGSIRIGNVRLDKRKYNIEKQKWSIDITWDNHAAKVLADFKDLWLELDRDAARLLWEEGADWPVWGKFFTAWGGRLFVDELVLKCREKDIFVQHKVIKASKKGQLLFDLAGSASYHNVLAVSPDGQMLASRSYNSNTVVIWDMVTENTKPSLTMGLSWRANAAVFSPDGKVLALGGQRLILYDVASGKEIKCLEASNYGEINSIAFSPDGSVLASNKSGAIQIWDVQSGKKTKEISTSSKFVAFSLDGLKVVGGDSSSGIKYWDVESLKNIETISKYKGTTDQFVYSPNAESLARVEDSGQKIQIWNRRTGGEMSIPLPKTWIKESVKGLALSANGSLLAMGGADGHIYICNAANGKDFQILSGYKKDSNQLLAFSLDGRMLAAGSDKDTIAIWRVNVV